MQKQSYRPKVLNNTIGLVCGQKFNEFYFGE